MTVSRAFLNAAPIAPQTRARILEAAAEIGYYHNRAASSLASRRSSAFGIVLPTLQDSIYLPFVDGARRVFERHRSDYLLQTIDYVRGRELHAIGSLLSHRVQVILLSSIGHTPETRRLVQSVAVPFIEVGNLPRRPLRFAVGHSDLEAGYVATRRLIETGRRRIAIICGRLQHTSNARDRLSGYRRAHRESDLAINEGGVVEVDHTIDAGLDGLAQLMERGGRFDGIVIAGEIWSPAVLLKLLKMGIRVPDDMAVIGVGEAELARYLPVPMTYVALPRAETGSRAAELAIEISEGREALNGAIKLPVTLELNASA